jgi:hypothetical protein
MSTTPTVFNRTIQPQSSFNASATFTGLLVCLSSAAWAQTPTSTQVESLSVSANMGAVRGDVRTAPDGVDARFSGSIQGTESIMVDPAVAIVRARLDAGVSANAVRGEAEVRTRAGFALHVGHPQGRLFLGTSGRVGTPRLGPESLSEIATGALSLGWAHRGEDGITLSSLDAGVGASDIPGGELLVHLGPSLEALSDPLDVSALFHLLFAEDGTTGAVGEVRVAGRIPIDAQVRLRIGGSAQGGFAPSSPADPFLQVLGEVGIELVQVTTRRGGTPVESEEVEGNATQTPNAIREQDPSTSSAGST